MSTHKKLTYTQIIALGFIGVIFLGAFLLTLPVSSRTGEWTPFLDALFTSVSSCCVTGLVVVDTYTHWSIFGQLVILVLIQIGGIGFMTMITMFSIFLGRKISLHERRLLMQSAGTMRLSGIIRLVKQIIFGTLAFELAGALLLSFRFVPDMGFPRGVYNALFHSVSAFCNAGFDLMGRLEQYSSLTAYVNDPVVNLTLIFLIVVGGIGFLVWEDLVKNRLHFSRYTLHSKIVLISTALLIAVPALLFALFDGLGFFPSLFMSVTPRTAGFNTIDLTALSESGSLLTIVLMFIGGGPGSTAGGIKTTTLVILIMSAAAAARHSTHIEVFKRRVDSDTVRQSAAVLVYYLAATVIATIAICALEPFTLKQVLFEVFSAAGTVGLSLGITPMTGTATRIILMLLMFGGRVGLLSPAAVFAEKKVNIPVSRPVEKILIG